MANHQSIEKEDLKEEEASQQKRTIMSKYTRPIEFIAESSTIPEKERKKQKIISNGDKVASFYRSIISTSSKTKSTDSIPISSDIINKPKKIVDIWWCKSCSQSVPKSDYKRHIQGTAHMVSNASSESAPDILTLNGKNVGFRMLQLQGWRYEEGLGKNAQGRRLPIPTVLKQDRLSIGHEETGHKAITHKYKDIEKKAIARQRMEAESRKDPGKEIARKAKAESERRAAILRYMKN
jgi:hypothetical protein